MTILTTRSNLRGALPVDRVAARKLVAARHQ